MKALFIGGTGTISASVSSLAARRGWELWLLNRGNRSSLAPEGVNCIQADIQDEGGVAALIKDAHFDCVVDFIAFLPEQVRRDIRLFAGKTEQYIFISSASVYKRPSGSVYITEGTPLYNPYWRYSQEKIACEECLKAEYRASGFPFTCVRPSHTYSHLTLPLPLHGAKGSWQTVSRMREGKPVIVPGDGSAFWTLTHSEDFAKAFVGLMGEGRAIGEAYHITSDFSLTWNEVLLTVARALGVTPDLRHISSDFLAACDNMGYGLRGALLGDKSVSALFDNAKIKAAVPGYVATISAEQGLRRSVEHMLAHPELQRPDEDFDVWCDKVAAAHEAGLAAFGA